MTVNKPDENEIKEKGRNQSKIRSLRLTKKVAQ